MGGTDWKRWVAPIGKGGWHRLEKVGSRGAEDGGAEAWYTKPLASQMATTASIMGRLDRSKSEGFPFQAIKSSAAFFLARENLQDASMVFGDDKSPVEAGTRFFDTGTTAFNGPHREEMN